MGKTKFRGMPGGGRTYTEKQQRAYMANIAANRDDAARVALQIATCVLNSEYGFGYQRLDKFARSVQQHYEAFYADREYQEEKLKEQLAGIGFLMLNGSMYSCRDDNGELIRGSDAEEDIRKNLKENGVDPDKDVDIKTLPRWR